MAVRFNDNSMVVGSEEMENADNGNECFMPVFSNEQDEKSFFLKLSDTLSGTKLLMEYLNNKGYTSLEDYTPSNKIFYYRSKAPKTKKIFIVKNSLLDSGLLSIFFKEYDLNEEDKQCLIELVPIKYNNNLSYSPKEEKQFQKEGLTPLILKAFEHNHINVKHREKELEILFFENKQELYNSINYKPQ